mmetsp:Transcript_10589/g.65167  ORF Transcript_10589/g.65167 Transcript_10589/m.65167 type:complete len:442 (-) Transcript_10589:2764-4089(-)
MRPRATWTARGVGRGTRRPSAGIRGGKPRRAGNGRVPTQHRDVGRNRTWFARERGARPSASVRRGTTRTTVAAGTRPESKRTSRVRVVPSQRTRREDPRHRNTRGRGRDRRGRAAGPSRATSRGAKAVVRMQRRRVRRRKRSRCQMAEPRRAGHRSHGRGSRLSRGTVLHGRRDRRRIRTDRYPHDPMGGTWGGGRHTQVLDGKETTHVPSAGRVRERRSNETRPGSRPGRVVRQDARKGRRWMRKRRDPRRCLRRRQDGPGPNGTARPTGTPRRRAIHRRRPVIHASPLAWHRPSACTWTDHVPPRNEGGQGRGPHAAQRARGIRRVAIASVHKRDAMLSCAREGPEPVRHSRGSRDPGSQHGNMHWYIYSLVGWSQDFGVPPFVETRGQSIRLLARTTRAIVVRPAPLPGRPRSERDAFEAIVCIPLSRPSSSAYRIFK